MVNINAMNDRSVFHLISKIIKNEKISCVLIGGFAVNHYKVSRNTQDIDFLITKDDFDKIWGALQEAGYRQSWVQENFVLLENNQLLLRKVDFMFIDSSTLAKIMKEAQPIILGRQKFLVPSLSHLIALKLHSIKGNPKLRLLIDFPDVVSLIRKNNVNVESNDFKELCSKFGTEELYQRILEAVK